MMRLFNAIISPSSSTCRWCCMSSSKMAKEVTIKIKFVVKVLLSIAISVFMEILKELKLKIQAVFPNICIRLFNHLHPDEYSDFALYSNEIQNLDSASDSGSGSYLLMMLNGSSSTSFVNVPVESVVASIKSRVAVIEYGDFVIKNKDQIRMKLELESEKEEEEENSSNNVCIVCYDPIEKKDEIRDMPNCCHAFHRDCMDKWLDEGQITCPLCRSSMLPRDYTSPWTDIGY